MTDSWLYGVGYSLAKAALAGAPHTFTEKYRCALEFAELAMVEDSVEGWHDALNEALAAYERGEE